MKNILTLGQKPTHPEMYRVRQAARAVVIDSSGAIALLHSTACNYYKLPGGGIEAGENITEALKRELLEEIGSVAQVDHELGELVEWREFEQLQQISYGYAATLVGERGSPDFTEDEIAQGMEVVWAASLDEAIKLVNAGIDNDDLAVSYMNQRDSAILQAAKSVLA